MFLVGLLFIVIVIAGAIGLLGMILDTNLDWNAPKVPLYSKMMRWGFGACGLAVVLFCVVIGAALMFSSGSPQPVEGECYRAVAKNSYIAMNTGKTTTIVPYEYIDLVEMNCP